MSSERQFFVAGKFGAAQGVKGWVRVISYMDDPDTIFDFENWYIPASVYSQFIEPGSAVRCKGIDADEVHTHVTGGQDSVQPPLLDLIATYPLKWQDHPKGFAVGLPGLQNRNQAQLLTHQLIYLPLDSLEPLQEDYYWRDLIGMSVIDAERQPRGVVTEMLETGANDVLVVSRLNKSRILVPYIPERVILSVDRENKVIQLDWDFDDDKDEDDDAAQENDGQ